MPTSAIGRFEKTLTEVRRLHPCLGLQVGFTLVEILIVLVLLGIIVTSATLAMPGRSEQDALTEARRLAALVEFAAEESRWTGTSLALQIDAAGYRFLRLDDDQRWQEIEQGNTLRARRLPGELSFGTFVLDSRIIEKRDETMPLARGHMPAFRLELVSSATTIEIEGQPNGKIHVTPKAGQ